MENDTKNIKLNIYVSAHKRVTIPPCPYLKLIQVGSALASEMFEGMLKDNEGDNISEKNRDYCELTAIYWAWKNDDADYYGFFHYRRYLSFDGKKHRLPYILIKKSDAAHTKKLNLDGAIEFVSRYDIVLPYKENMHISAEDYYKEAPGHSIEDLLLVKDIIKEDYPSYFKAAEEYLSGSEQFFSNVFVMKKELFNEYCTFLFDILEKFDKRRTTVGPRADGFLAERILGIWHLYKSRNLGIKTAYVQRADILEYFDASFKKKLIYALFPPSTKLRARVKKMLRG